MRRILIIPTLLLLGACAAETPAQQVYAMKIGHKAALGLAVGYETLPRCVDGVTVACSEPDAVALIRRADTVADTALDGAEAVVRSPAASQGAIALAIESAQAALAALTKILSDLGVQ